MNPNPEGDETTKQIRERVDALKHATLYGPVPLKTTMQLVIDADYLLSLLDSQTVCLHCEKPIQRIGSAWLHAETKLVTCRPKSNRHDGICRAEPATTKSTTITAAAMRDRCVAKVRECAAVCAETDSESARWMSVAASDIITALQSLTLDQVEQEKSK